IFARLYREDQGRVSYGPPRELIHAHKFGVEWKTRISNTGQFTDWSVTNISIPSAITELATPMLLIRYRLPSVLDRWLAKELPDQFGSGSEVAEAGEAEAET